MSEPIECPGYGLSTIEVSKQCTASRQHGKFKQR